MLRSFQDTLTSSHDSAVFRDLQTLRFNVKGLNSEQALRGGQASCKMCVRFPASVTNVSYNQYVNQASKPPLSL